MFSLFYFTITALSIFSTTNCLTRLSIPKIAINVRQFPLHDYHRIVNPKCTSKYNNKLSPIYLHSTLSTFKSSSLFASSLSTVIPPNTQSKVASLFVKLIQAAHIIIAVFLMSVINNLVKSLLIRSGLSFFPSSLAAMMGIFLSLNTLNSKFHVTTKLISDAFAPGVQFIALTLLLYFIPPLVVFPLKLKLIENSVLQLLFINILGLILTLSFTGLLAYFLLSIFPEKSQTPVSTVPLQTFKSTVVEEKSKPIRLEIAIVKEVLANIKKPFDEFFKAVANYLSDNEKYKLVLPMPWIPLTVSMLSLCLSSPKLFPSGVQSKFAIQRVLGMSATIGSFLFSVKLVPNNIKKIFHPAISTAMGISIILKLGSIASGDTFTSMLMNYFGSSAMTGHLGAGDLISSLLTPAVVSFGFQLYTHKSILMNNKIIILLSTFLSSCFSLFVTAWLTRLMKLSPPSLALSPLTRAITTPLALLGTKFLNSEPTLASLMVVMNGIMGAIFGPLLLEKMFSVLNNNSNKENDMYLPIGLSIGASAHGVGTAALASEPKKFAASVISMTLTGFFTVALLTIPKIRNLLIAIAVVKNKT